MNGQIFGNYKIEQKLGEGGMGAVFRGVDMMLEREVAIKFLRPELSSQPQVVERFRSEAVTLAKLNHPNIATLFNFMRQGDSFFMVLEFVRGTTLDNVIQQRGALPADQAIPLFCQVLDGIQHAHDFGIIHRDIKPANMMLTEKGTLKVLDFGIARILGTARMTRQGNIIGTIEYMSPEQVRGFETDARSDIYSLGMLLYEMLTARCPFDMQNEFELMKAQIEQYPVPPRQLNPAIPESVEQAIWRAIQKDPAQRFQSASEFRAFLLNAGFAATGRLDPLPVGDPNVFGTRPVTQSPSSNPSSPYATVPMQALYPPPSQTGTTAPPSQPGMQTSQQPGAQTSQPGTQTPSQPGITSPSHPGVPTPSQPGLQTPHASNPGVEGAGIDLNATIIDPAFQQPSAASKETRVGTPASFAPPTGGRDPLKETRIGVGPMSGAASMPPQQGFAQGVGAAQAFAPSPAAQQGAKKATPWLYIAGGGVALVIVAGIIIGVAVFVIASRSKKTGEPAKPSALTEESKPSQQPTTQPSQQQQADTTAPTTTTTTTTGADQTNVGAQQPGTAVIPVEQKPASSAPVAASEGPSQSSSRPAAQRPASPPPSRPKQADSASDAKKRRDAALRALDQ
jgi:serine/threonine protein kinase